MNFLMNFHVFHYFLSSTIVCMLLFSCNFVTFDIKIDIILYLQGFAGILKVTNELQKSYKVTKSGKNVTSQPFFHTGGDCFY